MTFFSRLISWIPRPFKYIQRKLDIQTQWQQFKINLKPHRYKIYIISAVLFYPLYNPFLQQNIQKSKEYLMKITHQVTQPEQPIFQIGDNLQFIYFKDKFCIFRIKNLISSLLNDGNIKNQGLKFVNKIINDQKFVGQILQLLLSALKNQQFLKSLSNTSKDLILSILKDDQISKQLTILITKISSSQQVKQAFIKLIQEAFSSKQSIDTIINLLSKGISSPQVKQSLSDTLKYSINELLVDQQTLNQLKVFIFFLLRKFETDDQIKGMMDILFAKGLGLVKKKKDTDLKVFLKNSQQKNNSNNIPGSLQSATSEAL